MRKTTVWALLAICVTINVGASDMSLLSFYEVRPVVKPPKLDGKLDDACWQTADKSVMYYEYNKPNPAVASMRSVLRMLYNDKGIYLGITNYDDNISAIRAERKRSDDPKLWCDDCAEIYFDPAGAGIGFVKFVVNPIGTRGDLKRVDAAITLSDWNGSAWLVKTSKQSDAWVIEAFFPWQDLGKKAKPGDFWKFDHVRYGYSTGRFRGATWAPGGSYAHPENFGFIYFGRKTQLSPDALGDLLKGKASPPWSLAISSGFVRCDENGKVSFQSAAALAAKSKEKVKSQLLETQSLLSRLEKNSRFEKLQKDAKALKGKCAFLDKSTLTSRNTLGVLQSYNELSNKIEALNWNARIATLLFEVSNSKKR